MKCVYIDTQTYNEIQPFVKSILLPFSTTLMDLEGIMLSERSQTKKDKYCMISLICRI